MGDWFEELAGFREATVASVAERFDVDGEWLTSRANGRRMRHGRFENPTPAVSYRPPSLGPEAPPR